MANVMNWKQWKVGLLVAMLTGLFSGMVSALAGLAVGLTKQQIAILFAVNMGVAIGKDTLLFLQQHPADSISFDTTHFTKTEVTETTIKTPSQPTTPSADVHVETTSVQPKP